MTWREAGMLEGLSIPPHPSGGGPARRLHGRRAGTSGASLTESGSPEPQKPHRPGRRLPGRERPPPTEGVGAQDPPRSPAPGVRAALAPSRPPRRAGAQPPAPASPYLGLRSSGPGSRQARRGRNHEASSAPSPRPSPLAGFANCYISHRPPAASPHRPRTRRTLIGAAAAPPRAARQAPPPRPPRAPIGPRPCSPRPPRPDSAAQAAPRAGCVPARRPPRAAAEAGCRDGGDGARRERSPGHRGVLARRPAASVVSRGRGAGRRGWG